MQKAISIKIANISTKNTSSDRGNVIWLKNFQVDLPLISFSKKSLLQLVTCSTAKELIIKKSFIEVFKDLRRKVHNN